VYVLLVVSVTLLGDKR